ncbi:ferrous iron transport protein A [Intestinibacillus massiliensis]|uniref:FeoA family protein n=1 Tax=Intestinibacillus massiliensis TaxID=1871029 RepID=UPI000B35123D|nr:FeoA family protein [Intestinibacillus massiliensis]MCB6364956.1 ferrous iron transport protein A [Intestinibacillus massiliensis]
MNTTTTLEQIGVGKAARIQALHTSGSIRRRLLDLGMIPGTRVECLQKSPAGDPAAYLIRGAVIALRREDSSAIQVM